jgi:hypothetical protein
MRRTKTTFLTLAMLIATPQWFASVNAADFRFFGRSGDAIEINLAALPGVRSATREGRWWVLAGDDGFAEPLRTTLDQRGIAVDEFVTELATLEHAYLAITRDLEAAAQA